MYKVTAFNGSPRKNGNTQAMIDLLFSELRTFGAECESVSIGGNLVRGCTDCGVCKKKNDGRCAFGDDMINECIAKMADSDAVIIGSPTYFTALTPETKALIDRAGRVCRAGNLLRRKVGAAVVPARRAGSINVFQTINNFFLVQEMIVPGSTYWNMSQCAAPGSFNDDAEGRDTIRALAANIGWLLERLK